MATNRPRYTVSVTDEMFQQIEDFRYRMRYQTRSEATVELIRLGIEELKRREALETEHIPDVQIIQYAARKDAQAIAQITREQLQSAGGITPATKDE